MPCVIPAHDATSGNSYLEMASPTFSLTDILIRGWQTNSQVIVSGVPPRREKKIVAPDRRLCQTEPRTEPMKPCARRQLLYVRTPYQYLGYQLFLVPAVFQL